TLRALEQRHALDPFLIIGVTEDEPERVEATLLRRGIHRPVLIDRSGELGRAYGVRRRPTLVVVRPDGAVAVAAPGEPDASVLGQLVQSELDEARRRGTLARERFV